VPVNPVPREGEVIERPFQVPARPSAVQPYRDPTPEEWVKIRQALGFAA
jgi:hypothetical protein